MPDSLHEAGSHELELMVIKLGDQLFGVSVAKILEVVLTQKIHKLPQPQPSVEGVFRLRDRVITLVDLKDQLGLGRFSEEELQHPTATQILVLEIHQKAVGFRIQGVVNIVRVPWERILPVPDVCASEGTPLVAIAQLEDMLVQMLDFEAIVEHLRPGRASTRTRLGRREERGSARLVIAEDSSATRRCLVEDLSDAGYRHILAFESGLLAWEYLAQVASGGGERPDVLITDIEMPQLDGLSLCRRIRQTPGIDRLPVVLFSSLVHQAHLSRGVAAGATAQVGKPQIHRLVEIVDGLCGLECAQSAPQPGS